MRVGKVKIKIILGGALFVLLASMGLQIGASELAYYELQDELKDLASLNSARIGLAAPSSDDDLREAVVAKARAHDIALEPDQVEVQRSGTAEAPVIFLAADYRARIALPGYTFTLHFKPTSGGRL